MNSKVVIFKFNCEPVSINKLYVSCRGAKRFISKEGKLFKNAIEAAVTKQTASKEVTKIISGFVGKPLIVSVTVGLPTWLLKNGKSVRKKDIDNTFKALNDSVFTSLQKINAKLDDSYVWQVVLTKKVTSKVEVTYQISEYEEEL